MANEPGGTKFAQLITEIDLDRSKYDKKLDESVEAANIATVKIESAFKKLGIRTDESYEKQRLAITTFYKKIINDAQSSANERAAAEEMLAKKIEAINARQYSAVNSMRMAEKKSIEDAQRVQDNYWTTMGTRSNAAIEMQKKQVMDSYSALQAGAAANASEIARLEYAKNQKLKQLNDEMLGVHHMSMAAMMRAVLRYYAAWYVVSSAVTAVTSVIMSGVKAIDDLKISTIAVASQITSMQGTSGNVVENYRQNVIYAKALNEKLMEIDATSFANLSQIQKMNMAMTNQGVILDINKQKQIESFTALTNAVNMFTQGQDKEKQAAQEMRALFTGEIRAGNMVAMQMDALIRKQGEYKDGLKGLIAEGKKHGDTLERILPYLSGIVAGTSDIQSTWAAVSSSLETAWNIIQRRMFQGIYDDIIKAGQELVKWLKDGDNALMQFGDRLKQTYDAFKKLTSLAPEGSVVALEGGIIGRLLFGSTPAGIAIGSLIYVNSLMEQLGVKTWKARREAEMVAAAYALMSKQSGLFGGGESGGKGATRSFGPEVPVVGPSPEDQEKAKAILRNNLATATAYNKEYYEDAIAKSVHWLKMQQINGQGDLEATKQVIEEKKVALNIWYDAQVSAINKFTEGATEKEKNLAELYKEYSRSWNKFVNEDAEVAAKITKKAIDDSIAAMEEEIALGVKLTTATIRRAEDHEKAVRHEYEFLVSESNRAVAKVNYDADEAIGKDAARLQAKAITEQQHADFVIMVNANRSAKIIDIRQDEALKISNITDQIYRDVEGKEEVAFEATIKRLEAIVKEYEKLGVSAQAIADLITETFKRANLEKFGTAGRQAGNEAQFYDDLIGYEDKYYQAKLKYIEEVRKQNALLYGEEVAQAKKKQSIGELDQKMFTDKSRLVSEAFGNMAVTFQSLSSMYDESSAEYARMQDAAKAMIVLQQAVAVANAVAAIANQGLGDPYTAFARIAAMTAAMGGLLASTGMSLGGGGGSAIPMGGTALGGNTSILGGKEKQGSESIVKSYELLQDTYDMQYRELHGIYESMRDLNQNITGLVASLVRTGGIGNAAAWGVEIGGEGNRMSKDWKSWNADIPYFKVDPISEWTTQTVIPWFMNNIFGGDKESWIGTSGLYFGQRQPGQYQGPLPAGSGPGFTVGQAAAGQATGLAYAEQGTKTGGGIFGSDSYEFTDYYKELDAQVTLMFTNVFKSLGNTLVSLGEQLGVDAQTILDYEFGEVKINLQDLDAEGISKAVNEYISRIGDDAVTTLFGDIVGQYQQLGEGMMETAVRIAIDKAIVLETLEMTGQAFVGTIPEVIAFSESIIEMAGGLDKLVDAASVYYDKFFTDVEKQDRLYGQLTSAFSDMNMTLPDTREGYRALVEGLDLSTEAGMRAYVTLMEMAGAADAYYSEAEAKARTIADNRQEIQDRINAITMSDAELLIQQRTAERAALVALDPALGELVDSLYAAEDAAKVVAAKGDIQGRIDKLTLSDSELLAQSRERERAAMVAIDPALGALCDSLYVLEDAAKAATAKEDIQGRIDKLTMSDSELLAASRERERAAMVALDPALGILCDSLYALEDAAIVAEKAAKVVAAKDDIQGRIDKLTLSDSELLAASREKERAAMVALDPALGVLCDQLYDLEDAATAAANAARIASEATTLTIRLLRAQGNEAGALALERQRELDAADPANRVLLHQIFDAEDINAAAQAAKDAAQSYSNAAQQTADAIANFKKQMAEQKFGLQISLLEAMGMAEEALAAKRLKELETMNRENQVIQLHIWAIEDLNATIEKFRERVKMIADWVEKMSQSSALAPVQSAESRALSYASRRAAALAEGATTEDISEFLSYAEQYLEFQRTYGGDYQKIYDEIMGDVTQIGALSEDAMSIAEQQLAALIEQNNLTREMGENNYSQLSALINSLLAGDGTLAGLLAAIPAAIAQINTGGGGGGTPPVTVVPPTLPQKLYEDWAGYFAQEYDPKAAAISWAGGTLKRTGLDSAMYADPNGNKTQLQRYMNLAQLYMNNPFIRAEWNKVYSSYGLGMHASGGLTSGPTISGEIGPEWNVPTYEPQRSRFLKTVGADPQTLGAAIAQYLQSSGGGALDGSAIDNHIYIDGKEICRVVTKGMKKDPDLISATRRAAN